MEHDGEARRGFGRMGFGFVLFIHAVQALPEEVPDPRALLQRCLPLPPLPQRVHGSSAAPFLYTMGSAALFFLLFIISCGSCSWSRRLDWEQNDGHELDRHAIESVICLVCDTEQPVAQECCHCGVSMGEYFCRTCKFFDDDVDKEHYHCKDCGICRCVFSSFHSSSRGSES
ncbi:hypothetical protein PR202_ga25761 [Eleusine coracana subsp. coracana]|uniref:Uncharacterized protein n=1 Tax=Eleusine coracana subsp. coracana TaxID=191504 RepID=A0AAV5DBU8_ELECO|nr:hypothetical protein PR202_ga25761 [Eleusine coracana subsp. coracana]